MRLAVLTRAGGFGMMVLENGAKAQALLLPQKESGGYGEGMILAR